MSNPRVFISYSHDSDEHRELVRGLHASLSRDGCDCQLDVYNDTDEDWPTWMARQLEEADFVLCVITETYEQRFKDQELPDVGLGVGWEAGLIRRLLYKKKLRNDRIFPAVFAHEDSRHIPLELQGYDFFPLEDAAGYEALLRKIIKQPQHVRPATGTAPDFASSTTAPLFARPNAPASGVAGVERSEPPADVASNETGGSLHSTPATRIINSQSKLPHTAQRLIGRETELAMLDEAWNDTHRNVVVVRGKGGEGKTSLVASWMAELAMKDWRGAEWVLDWSFYSQGTRDQSTASGEAFIVSALAHFGDPDPNAGGPEERGARLARLVGERRGLLVLDGLEPLQYPPGPLHGQLHDKGVAALLKGLAGHNAGLCVVTTREKVDEIQQHYGRTAIDHSLEFLSPEAGAALLHHSGAQRAGDKHPIAVDDEELQQASREVQGHALTLFLIGQYLKLTEQGDIRRRDCLKLAEADAEYQNDSTRPYGHAFKAIEAYERWFAAGDKQARRQLAILRLLGLFDRPASRDCLTALRAEPAIPGLTESLAGGSDKDWNIALSRLGDINLVGVNADGSVDCHPLLREYFAVQLRRGEVAERRKPSGGRQSTPDGPGGSRRSATSEEPSEAWRAGHRRLYEHLCASTQEGAAPTLEALQPLYQAVAHGCHAGLQQEEWYYVHYPRILQRGAGYSIHKLGALGTELGGLASYFESDWQRISPSLSGCDKAVILSGAGFCLRASGRLIESADLMRASIDAAVEDSDWENASLCTSNLSELELTLGEVAPAERDAAQAVTYADRSGGAFMRQVTSTVHADALHQAGHRAEAFSLFCEAEQMQAESQPTNPLLYSLQGFRYCDLLLTEAERANWNAERGVRN